jgi:hypothetical protein
MSYYFLKCFNFTRSSYLKNCIFPENTECCICLDLLDKKDWKDEKIIQILPCGHFFHNVCIYDWMCQDNKTEKMKCVLCTQYIRKFSMAPTPNNNIHNIRHLKDEIERIVLLQKCNKTKLVIYIDNFKIKVFSESSSLKKQIVWYLRHCKLQDNEVNQALRQVICSRSKLNDFDFFNNVNGYFYFTQKIIL